MHRSSKGLGYVPPDSEGTLEISIFFMGRGISSAFRGASINPSDDDAEYNYERAIIDDLLDHRVPRHRLHHEVNHVVGYGREQRDRNTKTYALGHPGLRLGSARVDPD